MRAAARAASPSRAAVFCIVAGAIFLCAAGAGRAAEPVGAEPFAWELRLGLFAHDVLSPEAGAADGNIEILFDPLAGARATTGTPSWGALAPRLHAGVTGSPGPRTSMIYAGFSWTFDVSARVFVEASLGGAIHNGRTGDFLAPGRNAMGCRAAFRESASVGYRLDARWSVMASVEHASNGGICGENRGLTNFGLRLGAAF